MSDLAGIDVTIMHMTDAAVLVSTGLNETWIPRSVIADDMDNYEVGEEAYLEIAEWFAIKEGLV